MKRCSKTVEHQQSYFPHLLLIAAACAFLTLGYRQHQWQITFAMFCSLFLGDPCRIHFFVVLTTAAGALLRATISTDWCHPYIHTCSFVFDFIAAAAALSPCEHCSHIMYNSLIVKLCFIVAATGAFFQVNIMKHYQDTNFSCVDETSIKTGYSKGKTMKRRVGAKKK